MDLKVVEEQFSHEIQKVNSLQELLDVKSRFLGKQGHLSQVLQNLRALPPEERPVAGSAANKLKVIIEVGCQERLESLKREAQEKKIQARLIDVTLPGRQTADGGLHPISMARSQVESIFGSLGFSVHEGPEIETDFYNFEALNIPADHPARDMQDTFYIGGITAPSRVAGWGPHPPKPLGSARSESDASPCIHSEGGSAPLPTQVSAKPSLASLDPAPAASPRKQDLLLRTHTSPVQIHVMEKQKPPIRMIAPGVVYRRDSDASHSPMFHQVEGLVVGEGIRFSDLKGTLTAFLDRFFGKRNRIRFRPSYFPFTEPSAEVDVWWEGKGWLEVLGCGMVHPNVFRKVHYDPKKVTGYAFGLGIERLAMLKWGVQDIRMFYENDLRFLRQFR
ncbi:MAG: phenylalanine--tRNA ligase subunit alpha [Deltaproteobacteria bacterium]|nr:phenylalanine--tRNA ligase subunit alpha [Deltaproteobacteria bacterium]